MKNALLSLLMGVLCLGSTAGAQQTRQRSRTVADSINYIWKNIERDKNMLQLVETTYAGDNRLSTLIVAVWHISDHYGQLVEYLRLNGIVPPASQ
jgi:hypothetical protein